MATADEGTTAFAAPSGPAGAHPRHRFVGRVLDQDLPCPGLCSQSIDYAGA
jgi:hypothetical protein